MSSSGADAVLFRECRKRTEPLELFSRLLSSHSECFLLESATGPAHSARYSLLGASPVSRATYRNGRITFEGRTERQRIDSFLKEHIRSDRKIGNFAHPYLGGFVGYFSYDTVRSFEKLPDIHAESVFPDAELGLFEDGFIYDHRGNRLFYFSHIDDREREMVNADGTDEVMDFGKITAQPSKEEYLRSVEKAREHIIDGDIFQVVLSRRMSVDRMSGYLRFYESLRKINPSPYMYFVKFGNRTVIGSSPETLVRVNGKRVTTYPIAGTRPASPSRRENERLRKQLLASEKEKAEHNMLVDLARNDVGRVCRFGTVSVPEYMKVEKYSHVQHIVSRVEGLLAKDKTPVDAFFSVFPAGTVSGAPKIRAMEIIEELEKFRRGPYAGAVGYYSHTGCLDSAISIRTLFCSGRKAFLQAGGGIVYDSVPEMEYRETENKMGALMSVYGSGK
jgi:anthranilate synthase component 1